MKLMLFVGFFIMVQFAYADTDVCTTRINNELVNIEYDIDDNNLYENYTFREIFLKGWGKITCPAFVSLRHLTPDLTDTERSVFCLKYNKENKSYTGFTHGVRDAYLVCTEPKKSFCERVNATKDAAIAITGLGAGAIGGASAAASAAGVTAVAHSSGAVILTGSSGYIAGTLGSIGASGLAVLTAPVTVTTAAVSVVTVGGAVYYCKDKEDEKSTIEVEAPSNQINRTENTSVQN